MITFLRLSITFLTQNEAILSELKALLLMHEFELELGRYDQ